MQRVVVLAGTLLSITNSAQVLADTWCSTTHPNAIFCDDFDRYCTNPPPAPQQCDPLSAGADIRDHWAMWDVWDGWHSCGWVPSVRAIVLPCRPSISAEI